MVLKKWKNSAFSEPNQTQNSQMTDNNEEE